MADSRAMWFRVALLIGLLCGPATAMAQTWKACVDPRTGGLTAEGYRAVRDAAAVSTDAPFGSRSYHLRRSTASGAEPPAFRIVQMELMYAGISAGWISWDTQIPYAGLSEAAEDCFEVVAGNEAPGVWHYWGPYFELGSASIATAVRSSLEYLIPGYIPGRTLFRVHAYADTSGSIEQNERLSAARAEAIAIELVRLGVRWDDIEQLSFGESNLARPTQDGVPEPLNRRVWIDVRTRAEPSR